MVDAYPILANLFGVENSKFQLGHDVLGNSNEDNTVAFIDSSYVTNKIYYNGQNGEFYSVNGDAVDASYITENADHVNDMIDVSNDIITYDLVKEITNKKEN